MFICLIFSFVVLLFIAVISLPSLFLQNLPHLKVGLYEFGGHLRQHTGYKSENCHVGIRELKVIPSERKVLLLGR